MNIKHLFLTGFLIAGFSTTQSSFAQLSSTGAVFYPFAGDAKDVFKNADGVVKGATLTSDVFNRPDNAYQFGPQMHIELPDNAILKKHKQDYVIAAWVYMDSYGTSYHSAILSNRNNDNSGCLFRISGQLATEGPGKLSYVAGAGSDAVPVSSSYKLDLNKWYHVIMSYEYKGNDSNIVCFYVDGIAKGKGYIKNTLTPTLPNYIGFEPCDVPDAYHFNGKIDDLILLASSVTAEKALKLYNGCRKAPEKGQTDKDRYGFADETSAVAKIGGTIPGLKINYINETLIVNAPIAMPLAIQVYDMTGRLMTNTRTNDTTTEIALPALATGMYVVNVMHTESGQQVSQKIVKY